MDKVMYEELTPNEFRRRMSAAPIAYLPLGTLEWHGEHLPYGSDGMQAQGFFKRLAALAGGIVMPVLFFGPEAQKHIQTDGIGYYGMDILGFPEGQPQQLEGSAYFMDPELFSKVLNSVLHQLKRAGFHLVVAHGHGPSTGLFAQNAPAWEKETGLRLATCRRDSEVADNLGIQTDHAAANETSLMMALHPELVHMENLDPDPARWPVGIMGADPRVYASAELGERAIKTHLPFMQKKIAEILNSAGQTGGS